MTNDVEIGVWVDGVQKWVTGVTRRTTCHDVIKALLRQKTSTKVDDNDVNSYVIVERWRKVEKPLEHEQRLLKVWKTWGDAIHDVRFTLRKVRDENGSETKADDVRSECSGRTERSRRRHKWKHQQNHTKKEASKDHKRPRDDPKFSDTMERLMRLVVAQGETIQAQVQRLQERDNQIEQYEQHMHFLRIQNLGTDYLLHSYLRDHQEVLAESLLNDKSDHKDDLNSEEKSNDSGVVTDHAEVNLSQVQEPPETNTELPTSSTNSDNGTDELNDVKARITTFQKLEDVLSRLIVEEGTVVELEEEMEEAKSQQKAEFALLHKDLEEAAEIHSQLVSEVRLNDQKIREIDLTLQQRKKLIDSLLQDDVDMEMETRALQAHLNYIIHLPPSAFKLPKEIKDNELEVVSEKPHKITSLNAETLQRDFKINKDVNNIISNCNIKNKSNVIISKKLTSINEISSSTENTNPRISICNSDMSSDYTSTSFIESTDSPPPLPSSSPPPLDFDSPVKILDDDDDRDSANTSSSLCVSSRSSTSSEVSSSSVDHKVPQPKQKKPNTNSSTKDNDSTDSNSDTGLSSLHSSSDEGVYVLDTLV